MSAYIYIKALRWTDIFLSHNQVPILLLDCLFDLNSMAHKDMPHPLEPLSIEECHRARDIILGAHGQSILDFRSVSLEEPLKADLQPFLELEHNGDLESGTPRPPRLARVNYDVICKDRMAKYHETLVDVKNGTLVSSEVIERPAHAALTL